MAVQFDRSVRNSQDTLQPAAGRAGRYFWICLTLLAVAMVLGLGAFTARAQSCNCSCDGYIPPSLGVQAAFINDWSAGPSAFVTAGLQLIPAGCRSVQISHATEFFFPANTVITDVCVALSYPDGQPGNTAYVFFADPDPNNANLPGNVFFEQPFTVNVNGGHQIVNLGGGPSVFGQTWVGVRYPTARCYIPHQGVAPRLQGRGAVQIAAAPVGLWRDYDDARVTGQGAAYNGNVPLIRPLTLGPIGGGVPAGVFVNTGGVSPLVTDECAGSDTFSVVLDRVPSPGNAVVVGLSITDPAEARFDLAFPSLLFTDANWNVPQLVTVIGRDDPFPDGDRPYQIQFNVSSGDPAYHGFPLPPIDAINEDNDDVLVVCPNRPVEWQPRTSVRTPRGRYWSSMVYDSIRQRVVLFGGTNDAADPMNDTWEWDGAWRRVATTGPAPRERHAMAFDASRGVTVLYGGFNPRTGVAFEDTWEWDGSTWQLRSPGLPNAPGGARASHAMVHDPLSGQTLLYGGEFTVDTTTWAWDGTTWFPRSFPNNPGTRWGHAMTFDTLRGRAYLFGGDVINGVSQMWELDPNNDWTPVGFAGPPHTLYSGMAYDETLDRIVLFGGNTGGANSDQTWEWDLFRQWWSPINTTNAPEPRSEFGFVYDHARGRIVLFGGAVPSVPPGVGDDTWIYPELLGFTLSTRIFCVSGTSTGAPWAWAIRTGHYFVEDPNTPGVPAGDNAESIAQHFVDRINRVCCDTIQARVLPNALNCFEITIFEPAPFDFCVGPVGNANCCVQPGTPCPFNPDITEVIPSGNDCDGNLRDDALDLALDPALDANGNGILDVCETFLVGDLNCDGIVSVGDINAFVLALTSAADYAATYPNCNILAGDINLDGAVTVGDINGFVQLLVGP